MKQYKFNKNNMSIIVQSSIMAGVMLLSGCSNDRTGSSSTNPSETPTTIETTIGVVETSINATPTPVVYDFKWSDLDTEEFDNYFQTRFDGRMLNGYIWAYGFTDELNEVFTDFVNLKFNRNYESVPFSISGVDYFKTYTASPTTAHTYIDSYDSFCEGFCASDYCSRGTFNNRLIMSYLIQNNIPFGERVPIDNMKCILGSETYSFDYFEYFRKSKDIGNYEVSYSYTDKDLFTVLALYNKSISILCNDVRNPDMDLFTTNPEYSENCEKLRNAVNEHLIEYFGEGAPQLGQVPTLEDYNVMFPGEELVDVSRIPGGVFDPNEPRIAEATPDAIQVDISAPTIDENILGEWTGYNEAAGFTYIYTFYDDNTGTYESIHSVSDIQSGSSSQQNDVVDFTYTIQYGTLVVNYSSGNSMQYKYKINDQGMLVIGGMEYEYTSPVRSR